MDAMLLPELSSQNVALAYLRLNAAQGFNVLRCTLGAAGGSAAGGFSIAFCCQHHVNDIYNTIASYVGIGGILTYCCCN